MRPRSRYQEYSQELVFLLFLSLLFEREMEAGWVPRLVAEAERLRGLVFETSGQLPLHVLYDAALPALLQALQLVFFIN